MAANHLERGSHASFSRAVGFKGDKEAYWVDPEALFRIASLELRARIVVDGFQAGLHRSPLHGFSSEFSEYRAYVPGDDLRYLDWRLYARTERRYIKRFEEETSARVHLMIDQSASMDYGQERSTKFIYGTTLGASLARYLTLQRDAVGLVRFDEDIRGYVPARSAPAQFKRILVELERSAPSRSTGLVLALEKAAALFSERGIVVLISDLLTSLEGLEKAFGQLVAHGQEVICFRVLDPSEIEFEFESPGRFEDLETGQSFFVDPKRARDQYQRSFADHREALQAVCQRQGVDLIPWRTDHPLGEVLATYLHARKRRRAARNLKGGRLLGSSLSGRKEA